MKSLILYVLPMIRKFHLLFLLMLSASQASAQGYVQISTNTNSNNLTSSEKWFHPYVGIVQQVNYRRSEIENVKDYHAVWKPNEVSSDVNKNVFIMPGVEVGLGFSLFSKLKISGFSILSANVFGLAQSVLGPAYLTAGVGMSYPIVERVEVEPRFAYFSEFSGKIGEAWTYGGSVWVRLNRKDQHLNLFLKPSFYYSKSSQKSYNVNTGPIDDKFDVFTYSLRNRYNSEISLVFRW